jgi:hypothetical protein
MDISTCEEYVLNELNEAQNKVSELREEIDLLTNVTIKDLKTTIINKDEELKKTNKLLEQAKQFISSIKLTDDISGGYMSSSFLVFPNSESYNETITLCKNLNITIATKK